MTTRLHAQFEQFEHPHSPQPFPTWGTSFHHVDKKRRLEPLEPNRTFMEQLESTFGPGDTLHMENNIVRLVREVQYLVHLIDPPLKETHRQKLRIDLSKALDNELFCTSNLEFLNSWK